MKTIALFNSQVTALMSLIFAESFARTQLFKAVLVSEPPAL